MKFKLKQIFKMFMQYIVFPLIYFKNRWSKVEDKLVTYGDMPEVVARYEEMIK